METETKKHQRFTKRREREKKHTNRSCDEQDESPSRSDKRTKPRRKKNNANFIEEDIIDGFAIISFKTFEDLENAVKNSMNLKPGSEKKEKKPNTPNREKPKNNAKKKEKNKLQNRVSSPPPTPPLVKLSPEENLDCSPGSDQTEVLDLQLNGDQINSISQDSDASSHSSSGRGYLCDSESGDERASDASSDIFTAVNRSRECHIPSTTTCSSPCRPTSLTTTTTLTSSVTPTVPASSVTTTTATTTTCALAVAAATTNAITSTTTSCSSASKTPITTASVIFNGPKVAQGPPIKHHQLPVSSSSSSPVQHPTLPTSRPTSVSVSHRDLTHKSSSPLLSRTPKREDYREKDNTPLPASLSFNKPWASANNSSHQGYSPQISPTAGLSSFHSTPNHAPTFHPHTQLLPHPPSAHTPGHPAHSMFAPPLPPGPAAGSLSTRSLGGAATHSPGDSMSFANQEILREELNRRFLETQDRPTPSAIGAPPYPMRTDIHQHQHQHMHQHQHTHQHMYPIPFSASLGPPPAPLLYEKVPKLSDSPFYRQGIPGLSAYPADISPLLPPAGRGPLNSGIPGAFQPKRIASSIHPAQMRLAPIRDLDKATPTNPVASLPPQKKSGKWCAVHVRIAWEIYQQQQKQVEAQKGSDGAKSLDPLRPPSHLLPISSSIHKPPDLNPASSLLASASHRSMLESNALLGTGNIGVPPFPRPSPFGASALGSFGGLGSGPFSGARDMPAVPGIPAPHEWNRLHRTPPSFPTPTSWPKQLEDREKEREKDLEREREREKEKELEREREKEREKEKEREAMFGLDRRREEDRERERRNNERLGLTAHGILDRSRERERLIGHGDIIRPSRSRSRSRSPLQNGRVSSAKSNSSYEREMDNKNNILKIKEERRDEELLHAERERENKLRNEYLFGSMPNPSNPLSMFDRSSLLRQSPFLPDRVPPHPALWGHYEKSPLDFNHHRLQLQQDMERERERMISRLQHPVTTLQALEQDRLRKEELMLQDERFRRECLERFPLFERDRLAAYHEQQSRLSGLRAGDIASSHFQRTISPMLNHTGPKGGSPVCAPPPLIPSSSATSRSHSNSPAVGKPKLGIHGSGTVDPLADKRDTYSNSTDPDSHSR